MIQPTEALAEQHPQEPVAMNSGVLTYLDGAAGLL